MDAAPQKKQKPVAFILLVCMVLIIVIATGIFLMKSNITPQKIDTVKKSDCQYDKPVCDFLSKLNTKNAVYSGPITTTITITKPNKPPQTDHVVFQTDAKNNLHITSAKNDKTNNEVVMIGNTLYMKNLSSGVWQEQNSLNAAMFSNFREKALNQVKKTDANTTYTYIGTENCASLSCLKYQVTTPSMGKATEYVFFDNQDYLLRKFLNTAADKTTTEATFSYTPLSITPPLTK
ncbi:MAG: hypothetical protein KBD46_02845 [Candidatus Levybacteria bacterium]|nr:hypothetical protein [Candidatus Levybacteria bacterium]